MLPATPKLFRWVALLHEMPIGGYRRAEKKMQQ
jgi:hypothetical protein